MTWDTSKRKQQLRQAGTSGWDEAKAAKRIMRRDAGICHVCHQGGADEVDHVVPLSVTGPGGDHDANKAPIHKIPCHKNKTDAEAATTRARRSRRRPTEDHPGLLRRPDGDAG